jgi:outer membrane protein
LKDLKKWAALLLLTTSLSAELKLAVVDEQQIIDGYERSEVLVKKLEESFQKKQQELKKLESDIEQAEKEMRTASATRQDELAEKITRGRIELETSKKFLSEYFNTQRSRYTMDVIKDIEAAIETVGRDEGYDLILRKSIPGGPRGMDNQKTVFYHSEKVDVTADVLKYLNAKFRQKP